MNEYLDDLDDAVRAQKLSEITRSRCSHELIAPSKVIEMLAAELENVGIGEVSGWVFNPSGETPATMTVSTPRGIFTLTCERLGVTEPQSDLAALNEAYSKRHDPVLWEKASATIQRIGEKYGVHLHGWNPDVLRALIDPDSRFDAEYRFVRDKCSADIMALLRAIEAGDVPVRDRSPAYNLNTLKRAEELNLVDPDGVTDLGRLVLKRLGTPL